jgi:hypothetical protein
MQLLGIVVAVGAAICLTSMWWRLALSAISRRHIAFSMPSPDQTAGDPQFAYLRRGTGMVGRDEADGNRSILRWRRVRLISVVGDGEAVIVACRRHPSAGGPRSAPRWRRSDRVALAPEDLTMVLRLGDSPDATRAMGLLERWCRQGAWLQVRPAPVLGAVELHDTSRSTLRAPVAAT